MSEHDNIIQEALVAYRRADDQEVFFLIRDHRERISYEIFSRIARESPFTLSEWSHFLHLSERTLQRHKAANTVFDSQISEKIIELALLCQYGAEVLGDNQRFYAWLTAEIPAFSRQKPYSFLESSFGIRMIRDELGRLEHGVFS